MAVLEAWIEIIMLHLAEHVSEPHLEHVLVWPQQEVVVPQRDCDILQSSQIAAASIHRPQVSIRAICQPCDVLQSTIDSSAL